MEAVLPGPRLLAGVAPNHPKAGMAGPEDPPAGTVAVAAWLGYRKQKSAFGSTKARE